MPDMKLKTTRALQLNGEHVKENQTIKVDEADAKEYIRNGWAVPVEEAAKNSSKGKADDNTPPATTSPPVVQNDADAAQGDSGV